MLRKHVTGQLSAFLHGELSAAEALYVEKHLQECARCRSAFGKVRFGASLASTLRVSQAPESAWADIALGSSTSRRRRWIPQIAVASLAIALLFIVIGRHRIDEGPSWTVTGMPGIASIRPGDVLQTDESSEAHVQIADIGQLKIDPTTKIRLLVTQADGHRIALDHGKVEATTWAPPRLFVVETPSANAVDLGCKYTLEVEKDGGSLLHVTVGLVALEHHTRETVVPAGAFCRTHSGSGPGTPFFEDSSPEFQAALERVDLAPEGAERRRQLDIVLQEARVRDALSLWHLLPRLDAASRGAVYDRLAQLFPPPSGVTRDGIVALEPTMLQDWHRVVSQLWK
jgi:ferric-dicitrate binding protein FerR (iron transport regulator)